MDNFFILGVIHLLLLSYKLWGENKYLQAALKSGDVIWSRGLLKKGWGLCHGTAGNGYAFIHLYQITQEKLWLYRAYRFAEHCAEIDKHFLNLPDRPLSLFEESMLIIVSKVLVANLLYNSHFCISV